jgi:hypothetical protein
MYGRRVCSFLTGKLYRKLKDCYSIELSMFTEQRMLVIPFRFFSFPVLYQELCSLNIHRTVILLLFCVAVKLGPSQ